MKPLFLILLFLLGINSISKAQAPVVDTHPGSAIYALDYSTNQEAPAAGDQAILFKDAFIDLVSNTNIAKMQLTRIVPGHKSFVITQMDPQTNGNAYQIVLQSNFVNRTIPIYTFVYNIDQNTLSFFNPQEQNYIPVQIVGYNVNNLNNCAAYANFNNPNPQQAVDPATQASADAPVDADVTATTVPPAMPDYDQPECPVDGYLWQPGFWAYSADGGYYWVPGAWVAPPNPGVLWTPPYWGFVGGVYAFHVGYWGPTIGFYGGINYGYGYGGRGFVGGGWEGGHFRYNTAVVRVNTTVIHNTYVDRTVINNTTVNNHTSFNGQGGVIAKPNEQEMKAANEHHIMATPEQNRNQHLARADKSQFASVNKGKPANVAAAKVPARGAVPAGGQKIADNARPGSVKPGAPAPTGVKPGAPGPPKPGAPSAAKPGAPNKPKGGFFSKVAAKAKAAPKKKTP